MIFLVHHAYGMNGLPVALLKKHDSDSEPDVFIVNSPQQIQSQTLQLQQYICNICNGIFTFVPESYFIAHQRTHVIEQLALAAIEATLQDDPDVFIVNSRLSEQQQVQVQRLNRHKKGNEHKEQQQSERRYKIGKKRTTVEKTKKGTLKRSRTEQQQLFKCDHPGCDRAFYLNSSLTKHQKTHNEERPFKYTHLDFDKAFKQNHHLKEHASIHDDPVINMDALKNIGELVN
jgi:Zinc finger, C2H2 type